ncbi:glycosyl transferase [Rhodosalinus sp. 5P4]|uniref:glycosyl transferase n=1 Tax=Rhodosalinus sp. 5P4 TaxID=3239196 RepID=UPI003526801A
MADFHQNGQVATLHDLRSVNPDTLSHAVATFARDRPVTLVLPSLYSEIEGPALSGILDELAQVPYLHRIVIGLDQADAAQYAHAIEFFARLPQEHVVIWNDSPRQRALGERLKAHGLYPSEPGKGKNVWTCLGYVLARRDTAVMAIHDCDITTYSRHMLTRLVYPLVNPNFPYQLSKGFYPRIGEGRINGRVTRLLVSPLLVALRKVIGDRDYIDYLRSFRYPLSGEFAMRSVMLPDLRIPSDWGLEIGVLSEAWRNLAPKAVCQVEIADAYDHKHQDLSPDDAATGLNRMSTDICKAIVRKLAADGTVFTQNTFRTLKAVYYRAALDMLESYYNDAAMNGLSIDRHKEEQSIELFAENIMRAGQVFLENPFETPFIPTWSRVNSADPELLSDMLRAVEEDLADIA